MKVFDNVIKRELFKLWHHVEEVRGWIYSQNVQSQLFD